MGSSIRGGSSRSRQTQSSGTDGSPARDHRHPLRPVIDRLGRLGRSSERGSLGLGGTTTAAFVGGPPATRPRDARSPGNRHLPGGRRGRAERPRDVRYGGPALPLARVLRPGRRGSVRSPASIPRGVSWPRSPAPSSSPTSGLRSHLGRVYRACWIDSRDTKRRPQPTGAPARPLGGGRAKGSGWERVSPSSSGDLPGRGR